MDKKSVCPICGEPTNCYMGNYRKDGLCRTHAKEFKDGKIIQCQKCGKWHKTNEPCDCEKSKKEFTELPTTGFDTCVACGEKTTGYAFCKNCWYKYTNEEMLDILNKKTKQPSVITIKKENPIQPSIENQNYEKCIVCGEPTNGKPQCKNCWNETKDYCDGLDKNKDLKEFRDHYFNLKDVIFRMHDFDIVKTNCNKLIAIAITNEKSNNDTLLTSTVYKDVVRLIEVKKPKVETPIPEKVTQKDEQKTNILTAIDGHKVKSSMEQLIDDVLWNSSILHSYEPDIMEITSKNKKADWFIPIIGTGLFQGIYIEYWGMTTPQYISERKEKEELYKKYDIPYIGIEKDTPKDSNTLKTILIREISRLAEERFQFMPHWKK